MAFRANGYFNDPGIAQAAANLAGLFAPPSGSEAAGWAAAKAKKDEAQRLQWLFDNFNDPSASQRSALTGVQTYGATPEGFRYNVDQGNATQRYGYDTQAATSRANNAADNVRALEDRRMQEAAAMERLGITDATARVKIDADNARAIETNRLDNQRAAIGTLFQPLNPGQIRPEVGPEFMDALQLPSAPAVSGAPKPQTEDELKAAIFAGLPDEQKKAIVFGSTPIESVVTPEGPRNVLRTDAVGQQPAEKGPQTVVNMGPNGVDYGNPGNGLVWARTPDGKVRLDERGAPVAIPFQGGEVWRKEQAAKAADESGDARADTKNNIVIQDIDRAIAVIDKNPLLTTGAGNQATSRLGGTPAHDLNALLDTVKANVGFDQLQAMRDASPTGGALGQVSEFENRLLQSVMGSLETTQSADQLKFNLKRLRTVIDEIVNRGLDEKKAAQMNLTGGAQPAAAPTGATAGPQPGDIEDGYRFKGGDPKDPASWELAQ